MYICIAFENIKILSDTMSYLLILLGVALIIYGANFLTDGASSIAKQFNISNFVIGLTIVAFGTSAPELTVSLVSAMKGSAEMALGNVVGSNIVNTLLIVGCTAAITPLAIAKGTVRVDIPLSILAALILIFMSFDVFLDDAPMNIISRSEGMVLLLFFVLFIAYTFAIAHSGEDEHKIKQMPVWKALLFIVGGLLGLIYGGRFFVNGASDVARQFGVSESVIGLTLLAGGTSLPELATSVVAAWKKNPGMAIGNVVGSNLFNILLVVGASATVLPMPVGGITPFDFGVLLFSSVLLYIFGLLFGKNKITRWEGIVLVLCYVAYTVYLITRV